MEEPGLKHGVLITSPVLCSTILWHCDEWTHSKHSTGIERAMGKGIFTVQVRQGPQVSVPWMTWEFCNPCRFWGTQGSDSATESDVQWGQ